MQLSIIAGRHLLVVIAVTALLPIAMPGLPAAEGAAGRRLRVGPGQAYKLPSAAAAAAKDGDTVEIEAGDYPGDVAVWSANRLTLRGINGRARLAANGNSAQQKAIWVIRGNDTTVEQIEFSGCRVADHNGAGIRHEGTGLVVRHCSFHDNEDGILTGANAASDVLVEFSEFARNGAGDGYSHNLYIGQVRSFTLQFCGSRLAKTGHLVKSRAQTNYILYNRLMDEQEGSSSYVIDLPNGGRSFIIGNILQHGPHAENGIAVSYAAEGAKNAVQELYVVNNTYLNERGGSGTFLRVAGTPPVVRVVNNLITGTQTVLSGPGQVSNNLVSGPAVFVDAAHGDYRLAAHSAALAAGIDPGTAGGFGLAPKAYYRHPFGSAPRPATDKPDLGACPAGSP